LELKIILNFNWETPVSRRFKSQIAVLFVITAIALAGAAAGAQDGVTELRFDNRHFVPQTLTVPAGQPFMVEVVNSSQETIEFESFKLNREKAVEPGKTMTVHMPALSPGSYDFSDDFHQDVPQGSIIAK
jgi:cupredoxin-like protein